LDNKVGFTGGAVGTSKCLEAQATGQACNSQANSAGLMQSANANESGEASEGDSASYGLWIAGNVRSGDQDAQGGSAGLDFETDGLSIGIDKRISSDWVLGGGVGYGKDETRVGDNGTRSSGEAFTAAIYSSYKPGEAWFFDALLGYQDLNYNLRRYVTINGNTVFGERDGTQWFASFLVGADYGDGPWKWSPYARWDLSRATLDAYTEEGDAIFGLAYDELTIKSNMLSLGLRGSHTAELDWGMFTPQLRIEYQHDFQGDTTAGMQYASFPSSPFYEAVFDGYNRNRWLFGLGASMDFNSDWKFVFELQSTGSSSGNSNGVQVNLEKSF
ncbi:MAG: autotransporter outer membrane beta-barrel domain-containing protein, partial [Arenimonas sp.]